MTFSVSNANTFFTKQSILNMEMQKDMITINANIDISSTALEAIVENAKKVVGRNEKGVFRVDTSETVNKLISQFLLEQNFEAYVKNIDNVSKILR